MILGQKYCFLGPTIFKIPQSNWYYQSIWRKISNRENFLFKWQSAHIFVLVWKFKFFEIGSWINLPVTILKTFVTDSTLIFFQFSPFCHWLFWWWTTVKKKAKNHFQIWDNWATAWALRMPDESWWLPEDCLKTFLKQPDDCLTTAWRLPDDCLTAAWLPLS